MRGIYPAVMTAYDAEGRVSTDGTLALVDSLLASGVHGLFIGGTAGEGPIQSVGERTQLTTAISEHVNGAVPIIAHVGAMPYGDTLALARHAKEQGIAKVAAIPPLFYAINGDDIRDYYRALARDLGEAVMAYHVPNLTHRPASSGWLAALGNEGSISGVKFSADDLAEVQAVIEQTRGTDFMLLSGSDPLCMGSAIAGSHGAVGVSINAMPAHFVRLWDAVATGDLATAAQHQLTVSRFVTHMFQFNFIGYLRHVLTLQGIDIGVNRLPLPNLSEAQKAEITNFVTTDEEISAALGLS